MNEAIDLMIPQIKNGACIALHGEMGAGKTTLISQVAASYGITEVTSPTYSIINEYPINSDLFIAHMDWYRLKDANEIIDAGILEYISNPQYATLIEWSERAPELLPSHCIHFYLSMIDSNSRRLRMG